jgi:hypothetical protein
VANDRINRSGNIVAVFVAEYRFTAGVPDHALPIATARSRLSTP